MSDRIDSSGDPSGFGDTDSNRATDPAERGRQGSPDPGLFNWAADDQDHLEELELVRGVIEDLGAEAYGNSEAHGWYAEERSVGDLLALMHSELSEALEQFRDGRPLGVIHWTQGDQELDWRSYAAWRDLYRLVALGWKPDGFVVELADVLIRIFDMAGARGLPLGEALLAKMAYNRTRPMRHGGKRL